VRLGALDTAVTVQFLVRENIIMQKNASKMALNEWFKKVLDGISEKR